jgi:soluble cytochrome b562
MLLESVINRNVKMLGGLMGKRSVVVTLSMEKALEKGEISLLESEAEKITAEIPDLKKSKPHKNIKQQSTFIDHATNLENAVTKTVNLATKGNLVEAKAAFKKVEKTCTACHAKFRD